jgi:hypothetical protein
MPSVGMRYDHHREKQSKRRKTVCQLASEVEFRRLRVQLEGLRRTSRLANVGNDLGVLDGIVLENLACSLEDGQLQGCGSGS